MKLTDYNLKNTTSYDNGYGNILLVGVLENGPIGQPFTITSNKNIFTLLGNNPTTRYANYLINNDIDKDGKMKQYLILLELMAVIIKIIFLLLFLKKD